MFGATGGTGRAVIDQALGEGHAVTAFVRDRAKLAAAEGLSIVEGDAVDPGDVVRAVAGQEAVVVALGNSQNPFALKFGARWTTPKDICEAATRNIITALPAGSDIPVVVVSAFGIGDTRAQLPMMFKVFYKLFLKEHMDDKERQEAALKASEAHFVLVQPVGLTDKPASRDYWATTDGTIRKSEVSRQDVAAFILRELRDRRHTRQTVSLSG